MAGKWDRPLHRRSRIVPEAECDPLNAVCSDRHVSPIRTLGEGLQELRGGLGTTCVFIYTVCSLPLYHVITFILIHRFCTKKVLPIVPLNA